MTNSNGNRDDELETIKQILMTVAQLEDFRPRTDKSLNICSGNSALFPLRYFT